jgi:hypothetical protein
MEASKFESYFWQKRQDILIGFENKYPMQCGYLYLLPHVSTDGVL